MRVPGRPRLAWASALVMAASCSLYGDLSAYCDGHTDRCQCSGGSCCILPGNACGSAGACCTGTCSDGVCPGSTDAGGLIDAGSEDGGQADGGVVDAGAFTDAGGLDGGATDAGSPDAGVDGGPVDAGPCQPLPNVASGTTAVAYQIDPAHTGAQPADTINLPLCRRWFSNLGAPTSYALVASGRVFVAAGSSNVGKVALFALDEHDGGTLWGPVPLGGPYYYAGLAYDDGGLFVLNSAGLLRAIEPADGGVLWSASVPNPRQGNFDTAPVASGGVVVVAASGNLSALSEADGGLLWTATAPISYVECPVALAGGAAFSACGSAAAAFSTEDGGLFWQDVGATGGTWTPAVFNGYLYIPGSSEGEILDATDGGLWSSFNASHIPAFAPGTLLASSNGVRVTASTLDGGSPLWTFGTVGSLDVITAPLVVGPYAVVGGQDQYGFTTLYVLSLADGGVVGSDPLRQILSPNEGQPSAPQTGLSEADGILFVPTNTGLVAY